MNGMTAVKAFLSFCSTKSGQHLPFYTKILLTFLSSYPKRVPLPFGREIVDPHPFVRRGERLTRPIPTVSTYGPIVFVISIHTRFPETVAANQLCLRGL
jgi:hypothetical protein